MEQISVNLTPSRVKETCHASQYDVGRRIRLALLNGRSVYTLSGTETVTLVVRKPDGTEWTETLANTSSTYVDLITNRGNCDQSGTCKCEIRVVDNGVDVGSGNFDMKVEADTVDGMIEEKTASGAIATFEAGVPALFESVNCSINPIQNGTPWIDSNEVNKEPYIKRAVAGTASRIGNHLYDKLVGGTVAFNQLAEKGQGTANSATKSYDSDTGIITITPNTYTGNDVGMYSVVPATSVIVGHKYFCSFEVYADYDVNFDFGFVNRIRSEVVTAGSWQKVQGIQSYSSSTFVIYGRLAANGWTSGIFKVRNVMCIDLTAMFGSTIADYIYGLEQATAGAGVAWFKALFPNDYYAYNAGELMSVKATAHVMKNASNTVIGNYALDSNLVLNGLFKLDANNKLYADGDTYESSGAVGRRYNLVDLGSLTWTYSNGFFRTSDIASLIKKPTGQTTTTGVICANGYKNTSWQAAGDGDKEFAFSSANGEMIIKDSAYTDAAAFKTAMSGVYLVYELATPTTEQASPFTNPQVCDENGTEEYTDNRAVAIPVGHETYQANICPITGFDELNIQRTGANLFDINNLATADIVVSNGVATGTASKFNSAWNNGFLTKFKPNTQYAVTVDAYTDGNVSTSGTGLVIVFKYSNGSSSYINMGNDKTSYYTFSTVSESGKTLTAIGLSYGTQGNNIWHLKNLCVSEGTDTTYHAYNGQTYVIAFGQTVYGGVLDVTRGKLHVTWGSVDLGDLTWTYSGTVGQEFFYARLVDNAKRKDSGSSLNNTLCSCYEQSSYDAVNGVNGKYGFNSLGTYIKTCDLRYSNADTYKAAISGQKVAYELATPFDIDLTPERIEALLGVNNVWHDGNGDTEVKYIDLKGEET